ncbi:hypothetical protein BRADI_1g23635v3 [Brachypodium distachyon]|uniref:Transmembrane protein n=1 Tax=Brachypodium distachyon TaxID=15368 RepID=A0A0Q3GYG3_BRADI|nr:hypothetical protein BRADI_1g23635v3 [Brachypodium distachyon]
MLCREKIFFSKNAELASRCIDRKNVLTSPRRGDTTDHSNKTTTNGRKTNITTGATRRQQEKRFCKERFCPLEALLVTSMFLSSSLSFVDVLFVFWHIFA